MLANLPKQPTAILFDFDGVLLDSLPLHIDGWRHALSHVYQEQESAISTIDWDKLKGLNSKKISSFISEYIGKPESASLLVQAKIDYVKDRCAPLYRGAIESIEFFQKMGSKTAIVSNASRGFIARHVDRHDVPIDPYFGMEDHPIPKPSPLAYINAASALGIAESDFSKTIVFEDTAHGVKAGASAKMFVIGVCTNTPPPQLQSAGAKLCINQISEAAKLYRSL